MSSASSARTELKIEAGEDRPVALGAEMEDAGARALAELIAGEVAGGDGGVIGAGGNAELGQLPLHAGARPRRIGQQHDDAALPAEGARRLHRLGISAPSVMHDAPNIDQPGAVALSELLDGGNERQGGERERGHSSP